MAACEKCWSDAYFESRVNGRPQADEYRRLLDERKDSPCTPEEQQGGPIRLPGGSVVLSPEAWEVQQAVAEGYPLRTAGKRPPTLSDEEHECRRDTWAPRDMVEALGVPSLEIDEEVPGP